MIPFGLTNVPAVFQAMINDVMRDFLDQFVYVYLDDILIYSPDLATYQSHVNQVLKRLLEHNLYVKAEKSVFHAESVSFLGFIVAPGKVQMDPAKVSAVAEWPTPDSRKKVQQFLGFAKFYGRLSETSRNSRSSPCSHFCLGAVLVVPWSWEGVPDTQTPIHHSTHPHSSRPTVTIRGGSGCVQRRSGGCTFSAVRERRQDASLCLPVKTAVQSRAELWCW